MSPQRPQKTSITTLARATGLSLATVSRALAGAPSVLPQTRDKVLEAAQRLHYVRDQAAVRLKTGKTHALAFVMDQKDEHQPGFQDFLRGLGDAVQATHYHLIVLPQVPGTDPSATVRYAVDKGLADGLVLTYTQAQDERVRYLQAQGLPFISYGRTQLGGHEAVDFANEDFAALAVQTLVQRGRKRLAVMLPDTSASFSTHLREGFSQACQQWQVSGQCVQAVSVDDAPDAIYTWARQHARDFDGVVLSREAPVLPLLSALADAGLSLGRELDCVLKYSSSLPRYLRQPLLACFEDMHRAGHAVGTQLLARLVGTPGMARAPCVTLFPPPPLEMFHEPR